MNKHKIKWSKYSLDSNSLFFLGSFLLPILMLLAAFFLQHIYPFGDSTLIRSDFNSQYINYFVYFKEHFGNIHSFIYSNQMALGGNMIGLTAYYLMSPFNLIFLAFSVKHISVAVMVISLIKVGLSGLTSYIFLDILSIKSIINFL